MTAPLRIVSPHRLTAALAASCALACATVPVVSAPVVSAPRPPEGATPSAEVPPVLRLPTDVRPVRYGLELTIDPDAKQFEGRTEISVVLERPRQTLWLHGLDLEITSATVESASASIPLQVEQINDDGLLKLTAARPVSAGAAKLRLSYRATFNPRLVGLYVASADGHRYAFTQFEDIHARRAFPCFDEPGFKAPFDVALVVPETAVAIANTFPQMERPAPGKRRRIEYAPTPPLPTYLLAWAVGPFDVVEAAPIPASAVRETPVALRGITAKGRGAELEFAFKASRAMVLILEKYFSVAYPYAKLDQVAVPDFAFGAMENAAEIHYREDLLLFKEGVSSEATRIDIAQTIAHELAHQWFGNLVTMAWWDDAWLNESFATWMGNRVVDAWDPSLNASADVLKGAWWAMQSDSLVSARAIRQPVLSVKNIWDQFDTLTYEKGAGVLLMFERFLGTEPFRQGISTYIRERANGSGSTDDLLAALSESSRVPVSRAFHTFLDQAGVPLIEAAVSCEGGARLRLRQSRYFPVGSTGTQDRTWHVPVCARWGSGSSVAQRCTLMTEREATMELPECPQWVMPHADGAGYYRWSLRPEDFQNLRARGYARLSEHERVSLVHALSTGLSAGTLPAAAVLELLEPLIADPSGEVAMEALNLFIKVRSRVLGDEDLTAIHNYTQKLLTPLYRRLGLESPTGEATSTRRLRLAVLDTLVEAGAPQPTADLARIGRHWFESIKRQGSADKTDPNLVTLALRVAVQKDQGKLFDEVLGQLSSVDDTDMRVRLLVAAGAVRDPARSARALAVALDPKLKKSEGLLTVAEQTEARETREAAWEFVKANLSALAAKLPPGSSTEIPTLTQAFCDTKRADEVAAFFDRVAAQHAGMPKTAREAVEAIRLCAALREAQRASALSFFSRPRAAPAEPPPSPVRR